MVRAVRNTPPLTWVSCILCTGALILALYTSVAKSAGTYQVFDTHPFPTLHPNGHFLPTAFGGNLTTNEEVTRLLNTIMLRRDPVFRNVRNLRHFRDDLKSISLANNPQAQATAATLFLCGNTTDQQLTFLRTIVASLVSEGTTARNLPELFAAPQRNPRHVNRMPAEYLALAFVRGESHGKFGSLADPSEHKRTTACIDDDGGTCQGGAFYGAKTDDDDDDNPNPCLDDDDGQGASSGSQSGIEAGGIKCCKTSGASYAGADGFIAGCHASPISSYDDEEADWDDEELSASLQPGNECDDDDEDDDDAKTTYTLINNLGGGDVGMGKYITRLINIEASVETNHDLMISLTNFANEIWTCAMGVKMPIPILTYVNVTVTVYVPFFNMTSNMTEYTATNQTVQVPVDVTTLVDLCDASGVTVDMQTVTVNATTQVLNMGVPQNVTMQFTQNITITTHIPTADTIPHYDEFGKTDPPIALVNTTHISVNLTDYQLSDYPLNINVTFVLFDAQPAGPFVLVGEEGVPCEPCNRLCEFKTAYERIQVIKRRTDRELVHLVYPGEREMRILFSHFTPHGDLLCELHDIIDWMGCFLRSMMFPQMERFIGCLEIFYFGSNAPNAFSDYVGMSGSVDAMKNMVTDLEFWYAEFGYYTQDTIDRGCISPAVLAQMQACFEEGNITAPGKAGTCTTEFFNNTRAKNIGFCSMNAATHSRYRHIRGCREVIVPTIITRLLEISSKIDTIMSGLMSRMALLAEYLREAREDYPNEYVFPPPESKCFAFANTTLAEFVPTGDTTLAGLEQLLNANLTLYNVSVTQP